MNYRLTTWILFGILLLMATGCSEDLDPASAPGEQQGLPVCFTAAWPQDEVGTRAVTDKTAFRDGDVIHVSAVFTLNQETTAETEQIKYATLRLSNGEWVSQTSLDMSWPWNATEATLQPITPGRGTAPSMTPAPQRTPSPLWTAWPTSRTPWMQTLWKLSWKMCPTDTPCTCPSGTFAPASH